METRKLNFFGVAVPVVLTHTASAVEKLLKDHNVLEEQVIGLDLEWKPSCLNDDNQRGKAAVLQIASSKIILLLQLRTMIMREKGSDKEANEAELLRSVVPTLVEVLEASRVLKVGAGIKTDGAVLEKDYRIHCSGLLELNQFYQQPRKKPMSLMKLTSSVLGTQLEKNLQITLSNWERETLSEEQVKYAAFDVIASRAIFMSLYLNKPFEQHKNEILFSKGMIGDRTLAEQDYLGATRTSNKEVAAVSQRDATLADSVVDLHEQALASRSILAQKMKQKEERRLKKTRKTKLYDNCELLAPDGELISMITTKKMRWYIEKGLALVEEESIAEETARCSKRPRIKLVFEPNGRTNTSHKYYLEQKENVCVSCGSLHALNKFYIVPYEFRKRFPFRFRVRSSHDVVLLCITCRDSYAPYYRMRRQRYFNQAFPQLPIVNEQEYNRNQFVINESIIKMQKCARPLLKVAERLPVERRIMLEQTLHSLITAADATELVGLDAEHDAHATNPCFSKDFLSKVLELSHTQENTAFVPLAQVVIEKLLTLEITPPRPPGCKNVHVNVDEFCVKSCTCDFCRDDETENDDKEHFALKGFVRDWRLCFIERVKPRHLPTMWSLYHQLQDYHENG